MPVLIRHRSAMSVAQYDESAPPLVEQLNLDPPNSGVGSRGSV